MGTLTYIGLTRIQEAYRTRVVRVERIRPEQAEKLRKAGFTVIINATITRNHQDPYEARRGL